MYLNQNQLPSEIDDQLDTFSPNAMAGVGAVQLGKISQSWLAEYEALKARFNGFVGFIIKTANHDSTQVLHRVPFLNYKQQYERLCNHNPPLAVIDTVWRDYFGSEEEQDVVALGLRSVNQNGTMFDRKNLILSGIPRHMVAKRRAF